MRIYRLLKPIVSWASGAWRGERGPAPDFAAAAARPWDRAVAAAVLPRLQRYRQEASGRGCPPGLSPAAWHLALLKMERSLRMACSRDVWESQPGEFEEGMALLARYSRHLRIQGS